MGADEELRAVLGGCTIAVRERISIGSINAMACCQKRCVSTERVLRSPQHRQEDNSRLTSDLPLWAY
jgi:hypothetical protein